MRKFISILLSVLFCVSLSSISSSEVFATDPVKPYDVNLYFFWGEGCPHCAKEKEFLDRIYSSYPTLKIHGYEVYGNQANVLLIQEVAQKLNVDVGGVPFTVVGDQGYVGYGEGSTDKEMESRIKYCVENVCNDSIASIVNIDQEKQNGLSQEKVEDEAAEAVITNKNDNNPSENARLVNLPFLGEVDAMKFSLPVLAVFMGAVDGFNPCAMWVLLFLISLLLGIKSRRRMWTLGVAFIVTSASVYFLFMAAWLQLILLLGFVVWVRISIGLVATIVGGLNVRSFLTEKNSGCKVTGSKKRQLVFEKLKTIAQQNSLWLALGGIILLAFAVNLVELVCSAGFPAVFTQVLSLSNLDTWQYYTYIFLYILFFMLDDIIIFSIAMITLRATGISTKYSRYSKLIGGILMLILGLMLIFKPEWLMFG